MERTTTLRRPTTFRFSPRLLDTLKSQAKEGNRSLNSYVENILTDAVLNRPNKTTQLAIQEARLGKSAGIADTSSLDAFIKSCSE